MSLNESIVEDAALEWFGELGYAIGHGPHMAPGELAEERDAFGAVVLVGAAARDLANEYGHSLSHLRRPVRHAAPKLLSGEIEISNLNR